MAAVINDIEALAEFRSHLIRFNSELAEAFASIRGHWRELGEVWRDDMYRLFGEALDEVNPGIELYLSATEGHEVHLAMLIERLNGYLEAGGGTGVRGQDAGRGRRGPDDSSGGRRADGGRAAAANGGRPGTARPADGHGNGSR